METTLASAIVEEPTGETKAGEGKRVTFAPSEKIIYIFPPNYRFSSCGYGGVVLRGMLIAIAIVLFIIIVLNVPIGSCFKRFSESMSVGQSDTKLRAPIGDAEKASPKDNLLDPEVRKLEDNGWHLYTMPGCHFCEEQMNILGGSYANHHVCRRDSQAGDAVSIDDCAGINEFPFWRNEKSGETRTGLQNAEELRQLC